MITKEQVITLSKKYKINESVVFREYLQVLFLSKFYNFPKSQKVFFKGGTALHLIYKAPRFSEDLDFTCELTESDFFSLINRVFAELTKEADVKFKERETIAGKRFLLTAERSVLPDKTFVNLDFSFREKVICPQKSIIETDYPVLFTSFVYHLSLSEIWAEKIRAVMTRKKGRDLYDLWYLSTKKTAADNDLIKKKLKYYGLEKIRKAEIINRINQFPEKDFVLDMRPFVPTNEREKLPALFSYIKDYLNEKLG